MKLRAIITLILAGVLFAPGAWAADYVLITSKSNPVSSLSAQDARNIFLGKKSTWPSGEKIVVFTQTQSPVHSSFVSGVVGRTPQQFSTFWKKALFTGTGIPPRDLSDDAGMLKAVAAQPGSIGYVSAGAADGTVQALEIR